MDDLKTIENRLKKAYSLPIQEQLKYHEQIWELEKQRFDFLVPQWDYEKVFRYLQNFRDKISAVFAYKTVGLLWAEENAKDLDQKHQKAFTAIDRAFKRQNREAFIEALQDYEKALKEIYLAYKNQKVREE
ncbi:MAG TPA: hypothetical protein GXX15_10035 [Clostridia bacterium]|nr:hypothetical protein [Clostridia bacterium]